MFFLSARGKVQNLWDWFNTSKTFQIVPVVEIISSTIFPSSGKKLNYQYINKLEASL